MDYNCVLLPVSNLDEADFFYSKIIGFDIQDDCYIVPSESLDMRLLAQRVDEAELSNDGHFPLFRFYFKDDLVFYCDSIVSKGANVILFAEYPGGYFMRVRDPFGNVFEVTSDNFQHSGDINPQKWDFYKRF
ncbi:VOC family protein [Rheinheimera hassiensis]|uniref:VOC family protein n=1 Tax=Rheinheimera hassiensis TaxID=1193627 RepID=UPI001F057821|nr:VOC family protein [Rheinheimera hassiensis]